MTSRLVIAVTLTLVLAKCATTQVSKDLDEVTPLVRSYSFDLEKEKHLDEPYVAKYEQNGKLLLYIASDHVSSQRYSNLLDHPTFQTIAKVFADYKPEVVVVEGLDTGAEISPTSILKKADECMRSGYRGCGESFFAINEARKSAADYLTGEPKEDLIRDEIFKEGYTVEDLLGFYLIRQIPQLKRRAEFNQRNFSGQAENELSRFQRKLGTHLKFGFHEFEAWYRKHMTTPKTYLDVTNNDPAPHGGPNATFVQRISNKVCLIRDKAIVTTIRHVLRRYSRILVVYGGSHLITEEPAIEHFLGRATYFKVGGKKHALEKNGYRKDPVNVIAKSQKLLLPLEIALPMP